MYIEKYKRAVEIALHLDEQPVMLSTIDILMDANFMIWMKLVYAWIEKHKRVVGSALHLDERPVYGVQSSDAYRSS